MRLFFSILLAAVVVFLFLFCSNWRIHPSNRFDAIENENINFIRRTSFMAAIGFCENRFFRSFVRSLVAVVVFTGAELVYVFFTTVHTQFKYSCHNHKLINAIRLFSLFDSPYPHLPLSRFSSSTFHVQQ